MYVYVYVGRLLSLVSRSLSFVVVFFFAVVLLVAVAIVAAVVAVVVVVVVAIVVSQLLLSVASCFQVSLQLVLHPEQLDTVS